MRVYSFDWATKKALTVYDSQTGKVKEIQNSIEAFEKFLKGLKNSVIMLFEFGGGDTFKIMAFRARHTVLQVSGKKIKDYRDAKGLIKDDVIDAKAIYDFYMENRGKAAIPQLRNSKCVVRLPSANKGGGTMAGLRNSTPDVSSSSEIKEGGSTTFYVRNSTAHVPSPFYIFQEQDADIAEIKILFRAHEDLKKEMVREKLKRIAFGMKFRIAQVADDRVKKILFQKDASIVAKEKEVEQLKKVLEKKVATFPIWTFYKGVKGVGSTIVAGLIGELGGRHFDDEGSLKHYAGMIEKKGNHNFNRYVKVVLYQFAESIIKKRTPKWRELYDNMKIFYAGKHSDWSKGKVDAYAKKFIETKFLLEFWGTWKELEC